MTDDSQTSAGSGRYARLWTGGFGTVATRSLQAIIVIVLAVGLVYAAIALKTVVIAVVLALILACAFRPLTALLARKLPNALAAVITLLIVVGVLAAILVLVGFAVAGQSDEIGKAVSRGIGQVETYLKSIGLAIDGKQVQDALKKIGTYLTSASFGSSALSGLSTVGNIATGLVLTIFVLFYFLRDGSRIWNFLIKPFRPATHARLVRIGNSSVGVLGAYVRGTATVALVDAVFIGVGLLICGVPLALPLSVLVFVTAFIPVVGATLAGIVAAFVALVFKGPVIALIVIGIVVVVNQLEGNLLQPLIMGRALSLHPLVILLALTAGTILGGIVGAILAVPFASVVWTAIKTWNAGPATSNDAPPGEALASGHGS